MQLPQPPLDALDSRPNAASPQGKSIVPLDDTKTQARIGIMPRIKISESKFQRSFANNRYVSLDAKDEKDEEISISPTILPSNIFTSMM